MSVSGKVVASVPIGAGVDAIKLDHGQALASTAGGALSVASEIAPGRFAIVQTVKTGEGARTMALDPTTGRIYLPAAEFEAKFLSVADGEAWHIHDSRGR